MGKKSKQNNPDRTHSRTIQTSDTREAKRQAIERERRTRTCACPPWEKHSAKCPVNFLLADDNPNLNVFEVIRRRKEEERFVEGTRVKEEVLIGTVSTGSNTAGDTARLTSQLQVKSLDA